MKLNIHVYASFPQTTKIGNNENKLIHSNCLNLHCMSFGLMWIVVLLGTIADLLLLRNLGNIHCQYEFSLNENRTIPTQSD